MKWPAKSLILILAVIIVAFALRLPRLQQRPMHTDEAVNAVKFGSLLEEGYYQYDSHEFHGPTLNYLTLIPAWLSSANKFTEISETTLRIVPVFFGVLLVVMLLLLTDGLGWPAVIMAALLTAISPAMVFYSRTYIQEMLMVCFTFAAVISGYRYSLNKKIVWAILTGIFLGLMHATKETCIIAYGAMFLAIVFTLLLDRKKKTRSFNFRLSHVIAMCSAAMLISAFFYSSFFSNWRGILDSILAYKSYFSRAGQDSLHIHPWYYYLKMLLYSKYGAGPVWTEAFIVILAGVGIPTAFRWTKQFEFDANLLRFLASYTILMTVIYSILPYKTPWNVIEFLHGMILMAGFGAAAVMEYIKHKHRLVKILIGCTLFVGVAHLGIQAYLANYKYYEDSANPYVYAHSVSDVYDVVSRVEQIAGIHPQGVNMFIEVIFPNGDYWPLPWYLRAFPNVGWWEKVAISEPAAPVIIASPTVEKDLMRKLYEYPPPGARNLYVPLFDSYVEMRPKVEIRGYVRKDLWAKFLRIKKYDSIKAKYGHG